MNDFEGSLAYYARQQCSIQWSAFLAAFSEEFGQQIPVAELRVLMARLGVSMAKNLPVPGGNTIAELEDSINSIWFNMDWGWIKLTEKDDGLFVEHQACPVLFAFGDDALAWSPAILEGIYAHWFTAIGGKDTPLQLTQVGSAHANDATLAFRYGRAK